jgi:hypothetical protein
MKTNSDLLTELLQLRQIEAANGFLVRGRWRIYYKVAVGSVFTTKRQAIRHWLCYQPKRIGGYLVFRSWRADGHGGQTLMWRLRRLNDPHDCWEGLRDRKLLAAAIRRHRETWMTPRRALPDPTAPDTLGWRVWWWDAVRQRLVSPTQGTVWETAELRVPHWDHGDVARGVAGIHAARMPRDWRRADIAYHHELGCYARYHDELDDFVESRKQTIVGVVERFGKYVLGTEGWRAEIAVIRNLRAPNMEIGLELEKAYPDVEVYYEDRRDRPRRRARGSGLGS